MLCAVLLSGSVFGQRWDEQKDSQKEIWYLRAEFGGGFELNNGWAHNLALGLEWEDSYFGFRYISGQENVSAGNSFLFPRRYPIRFIRSYGLLYGFKPDETVRIAVGLSMTRGNARGDEIDGSLSGGIYTIWHHDIAYRAIGIPFDVTFSMYQGDNFSLDVFARGEANLRRIHLFIGFNLSIFVRGG